MPYIKQTWTDEVPSTTPLKYKITQSSDGDVATDAKIELVTPVTTGSPLNAGRLNYMEEGIEVAQETAEDAIADAAAAQSAADAAQSTADNAIAKSLATAIGQLLYSTASGVWAALSKPSVDAVLKITSAGVFSWLALSNFGIKKRRGGSSTNWDAPGATNYTPAIGSHKFQAGAYYVGNSGIPNGSNYEGIATVTFPESFTYKPLVFLTRVNNTISTPAYIEDMYIDTITTNDFTVKFRSPYNYTANQIYFNWLAIGE